MIIKKIAIGNEEEAFIESNFSKNLNIILSEDNNKGKTIVIQSILYAIGNKPIFPESFNYKDYYYYLEFENNSNIYTIVRKSDSYLLKFNKKIHTFEKMHELKKYWSENIFKLPVIYFNNEHIIVDMELFIQMFFVAQDSKDTSTIFNQGYYHKEDFKNMILSYSGDYSSEKAPHEIKYLKNKLDYLKNKKEDILKLVSFYKQISEPIEYLSTIKDKESFNNKIKEIEKIINLISKKRKQRSNLASRRALWNNTISELRSLNSSIQVGELRCLDCNSKNIVYKGTGKINYSFDVSTPEMRNQIILSINEKILNISNEIEDCNLEIENLQIKLNDLMYDSDITIENVVAYKKEFYNCFEQEKSLINIEHQLTELNNEIDKRKNFNDYAKNKKTTFYNKLISLMNEKRKLIDIEKSKEYKDLFTKKGSVISGSEETVFMFQKF